jgi:ABC-2 type transport system permease protein
MGGLVSELVRISQTGLPRIVLWPFHALVALPIAASTAEFLRALPAVVIMLVLNFVWVLRSDASFEEASAAAAEKRAAIVKRGGVRVATPTVKNTRTPFTLALTGRPETALLWKNLIMIGRYASLKTFARLLPVVIVFAFVFSRSSEGSAKLLPILCIMLGSMVILFGPQAARNDLRMDLAQLSVLKTWPISGSALLRGELLAPAAILSALAWLLIIALVATSSALPPIAALSWTTRGSWTLSALLLAPGVILVQLVIQNGLAVMFPAWLSSGTRAGAGFDVMGQRMLLAYGMVFALLIALLPAAIAAGLVGFGIYYATGTVRILIPAIAAAITIVVGCVFAIEALGRVLDRTDVSAIDA